MTKQTGKDAGTEEGKDALDADDLALIDNDLEDEGKSDEDLWKELDASEGDKAADEEGKDTADETAAKDQDADSDVAAKDKAAAKDDEPETEKSAAPKPAKDEGAKDAEPTLAELKAERARLVEENRRLEQADRSNRGRVSALQQKLDAQTRGVGGQPAKKPAGPKKPFEDEKGKNFKEEYPDVAGPVAAELEVVRSELDEIKAERAARAQGEVNARLEQNEKVLDEKHPKWQETASTKDFGDWLIKQPRYVREAVTRNFNAIVDAAEAVDIFDRFEAFRSSQAGGEKNTQKQGKGNDAQDGPDGKQADGKNGSSLSGKRQRQLESSSGTRSTGPGLVDGIPEDGDPEAIWKAMDRDDERRERQARRA